MGFRIRGLGFNVWGSEFGVAVQVKASPMLDMCNAKARRVVLL